MSQKFGDGARVADELLDELADDDRRDEVRHVGDRLHEAAEGFAAHLGNEQGEDDREDKPDGEAQKRHDDGVADGDREIAAHFRREEAFEVLPPHPNIAEQRDVGGVDVLECHQDAQHGHIAEDGEKDECGDEEQI